MKIKHTILLVVISVFTSLGQVKRCCDTYVYEGYIVAEQGKKLQIKLNFLILLDSTMVGSYYYKPSDGSLKLAGKFYPDFTFRLVERNESDSITGYFEGKLNADFRLASGKWTNRTREKVFDFEIKQVQGESHWDYIKKNRALFEYTDLNKAIEEKERVFSIDVASQGLKKLPKKIAGLDKIVSFNLLGNQFESFPTVLSKLSTLDEISLSSNKLRYIGPEIGELKNLRILIINNNQLKELPKEIGTLTNLLYLEVGNNQLTSLPEEIKYLTRLEELHLSRNELSETEKQRIKKLLPRCVIHF
jgi:hypothetical protein